VTQLEATCAVRDIREVKVFGRNPERVKAFCEQMSEKVGTTVRPAASREETVRGSDIIVTMTKSDEPLFDGQWLEPGQFISATGANALNRREIDLASVRRADLIVVDSVEVAAGECGDLLAGVEAGIVYWENIPTLGDVIIGRRQGRTSPEQVTLYESHGMALQDLYTGRRVLELAAAKGIGTELPMG
jgi:ornithine cyclodeaminase